MDEVKAVRPTLLSVARGILGNDEEAEDVEDGKSEEDIDPYEDQEPDPYEIDLLSVVYGVNVGLYDAFAMSCDSAGLRAEIRQLAEKLANEENQLTAAFVAACGEINSSGLPDE